MKLSFRQQDDELEMNMSPMIDMVFLLLIFFIVAAQIIDEKPKVSIPSAINAKVPEDTTGRLMITVTEDEKYYIRQKLVSYDDLKKELVLEASGNENLRILIRADANTKYKISEKVMNACAEAGANDLIFAALEE